MQARDRRPTSHFVSSAPTMHALSRQCRVITLAAELSTSLKAETCSGSLRYGIGDKREQNTLTAAFVTVVTPKVDFRQMTSALK
jgi:hypothetical protein